MRMPLSGRQVGGHNVIILSSREGHLVVPGRCLVGGDRMHHRTGHAVGDDPCDGERQPEQSAGIGAELGLDGLILRRFDKPVTSFW